MKLKIILLIIFGFFLIILSYFYLDKPLVFFLLDNKSRDIPILKILANDIDELIGSFVFIFYFYFAVKLLLCKISIFDKKLSIVSNSVVIAFFLKEMLKYVFGRYWADSWICNNPSLIYENAYGFNYFTKGPSYGSFPSGHMVMAVSFCLSLYLLFPKYRIFWIIFPILVGIGQIGMYYHFLSDVMAGILVGSIVASLNYKYFMSHFIAK